MINSFLKDLFQDPRPSEELMLDAQIGLSYGWPSGHTQIAVTLWGFLAYELKDKWFSIFASLLIALIAFSRLYLGVHDLGDVFAGLVIGLIILGAWHVAFIWISSTYLSYLSISSRPRAEYLAIGSDDWLVTGFFSN